MGIFQHSYFRYGIALIFVGIALCLSYLSHAYLREGFLIFFLAAVMLAGWFGRTGAGLFAVVTSMITVAYFFIPPYRAFAVDLDELPYFLSFLSSALVTSWLGSARRSVEEKQKAHLDELFEQSPEAIMLIDRQDRVMRINKEFTHIFGYTSDETLHHLSIDLIIPAALKTETLKSRERLSAGQNLNLETVRKRRDGSHLDVSEVSFPVVASGICIAYYIIFRDITQSKRAFEELHKAQGELAHLSRVTTMGELASSIAHEVNQPIGAIATNGNAAMRWLAQKPPCLDGANEALECIVRDANRAADVIGRIRTLLKKDSMPMQALDMNELIRQVLLLTSYETVRHSTQVTTELADSLPPIAGDRVQLQQVVLNLIMNGLEALSAIVDRPRELHVRSLRRPDGVLIQIMDSGQGWDSRHFDSVFDPFFSTKKNGIGMGLTISRSIIEAHGGRLWAEQQTLHGAILNFTLPLS